MFPKIYFSKIRASVVGLAVFSMLFGFLFSATATWAMDTPQGEEDGARTTSWTAKPTHNINLETSFPDEILFIILNLSFAKVF
jgi:hypothetical protein